jgi:hypothetical protein
MPNDDVCSICANARPNCPIIHINDNGTDMNPNPVHDAIMCRECLIFLFETADDNDVPNSCPICRRRFRRPADALPKCSYRWIRKTKKRQHLECQEDSTGYSIVDHNAYCAKHMELGPYEMDDRQKTEKFAEEQRQSAKRQKVAERILAREIMREQTALTKAASTYYFNLMNTGAKAMARNHNNVMNEVNAVQAPRVEEILGQNAPAAIPLLPVQRIQLPPAPVPVRLAPRAPAAAAPIASAAPISPAAPVASPPTPLTQFLSELDQMAELLDEDVNITSDTSNSSSDSDGESMRSLFREPTEPMQTD